MAATWNISNLERQVSLNDKADVVTAVHWRVVDSEVVGSGDDAVEHSGRRAGVVALETSDLSSFKPYADITEEAAIAWTKEILGADEVGALEKSVADQIQESKTPTVRQGVPWE